MHNYRELKIWQRSMDLAVEIYNNTTSFPIEERFALTLQIHKSAVSIPSNISEGAGRDSDAQFQYFLEISMGSCNELQTQIELSRRLKYLSDTKAFELLEEATQIYKMTLVFYYKIGGNNPFQNDRRNAHLRPPFRRLGKYNLKKFAGNYEHSNSIFHHSRIALRGKY